MSSFVSWRPRPAVAALLLAFGIGAPCPTSAMHVPEPARLRAPDLPPRSTGAAGDREKPARITLGPGGRDLRLAGDLTEGVATRVAAILAANPQVARIHLTSDGGLVEEGSAIGALVAARGLATYVPEACASACTLAFVRGRERYLAAGAELGFHAPYAVGAHGRMRRVDPAPERAAYRAAGLSRAFVARALSMPPAGIWIPDDAMLRAAGVVTEVVPAERFPDSTLDADPTPAGARAVILQNLPILRQADPARFDTIARWYLDGYVAGRSKAEAVTGLRRMANAYLRQRFGGADDTVVRALGRRILVAMRATRARGDARCAAIASGDLTVLDAGLRAAAPSTSGLAPLLARTSTRADPGPGPGPAAIRDAVARTAGAKGCDARIASTERAVGLPVHEAAAALRGLFLAEPQPDLASYAGP